jgi:hypothetical protein
MGGQELLKVRKPTLCDEIIQIITTTKIPAQSMVSKEIGKKGARVWSGKDINPHLEASFKALGWVKQSLGLGKGRKIECDFFKDRIGLEVQFGKYSFVDTDFSKFEIFYYKDIIDLCVEILPSVQLLRSMYSGPADIDQVVTRIKAKGRNNPAVPIWIIGLDIRP